MARDGDTIAFPDNRHRVKVGDLREWHYIRVHCERCKHMSEIRPEVLQRRFDGETAISDLASKFKCRACGKVGSRFWDAWQTNRNA